MTHAEAPPFADEEEAAFEALVEHGQPNGGGGKRLKIEPDSGAALRAAMDEEDPPSWVDGFLDPEPSLHVVTGQPKRGKTTFALACFALPMAAGSEPWAGKAALPRRRVLVVSAEQSRKRMLTVIKRHLGILHQPELPEEPCLEKLDLIARHRTMSAANMRLMTMDLEGVQLLRDYCARCIDADDPVGLILLDSLSRLKPAGMDENSNDDMTELLSPLQAMAIDCGVHVLMIHHTGKAEVQDVRTAARGASSIGAVPQAIWSLGPVNDTRNLRKVDVTGNALEDQSYYFEVSSQTDSGRLDYFKPTIRPIGNYNPFDYFGVGEEFTLTSFFKKSGKTRSGKASDIARGTFGRLIGDGLLEKNGEAWRVVALPSDFAPRPTTYLDAPAAAPEPDDFAPQRDDLF